MNEEKEISEATEIEYSFASSEDFYTNCRLFKLIRYTRIGNRTVKAEYAKPAKLEWKEFGEREACEMLFVVPEKDPPESEEIKRTSVGHWFYKALKYFGKDKEAWKKLDFIKNSASYLT